MDPLHAMQFQQEDVLMSFATEDVNSTWQDGGEMARCRDSIEYPLLVCNLTLLQHGTYCFRVLRLQKIADCREVNPNRSRQ
mmetsp:Transcript_101667/g.296400  ORF Transcript_101667/g.296400 Transcript_101667/m.296400 type:complete len:81 (+) Transcript_101667:419-661(+)